MLKSQHGCAWSGLLLKNEIQPYSGYIERLDFLMIVILKKFLNSNPAVSTLPQPFGLSRSYQCQLWREMCYVRLSSRISGISFIKSMGNAYPCSHSCFWWDAASWTLRSWVSTTFLSLQLVRLQGRRAGETRCRHVEPPAAKASCAASGLLEHVHQARAAPQSIQS